MTAPCPGDPRHGPFGRGWEKPDLVVKARSSLADGVLRTEGEASCQNGLLCGTCPMRPRSGTPEALAAAGQAGGGTNDPRLGAAASKEKGPGEPLYIPGPPETVEIRAPVGTTPC